MLFSYHLNKLNKLSLLLRIRGPVLIEEMIGTLLAEEIGKTTIGMIDMMALTGEATIE